MAISACGWFSYSLVLNQLGPIFSVFVASCVIMLLAHIVARLVHIPTTVFIVACHYPYVPGSAVYQAVFCLINNDYAGFEQNLLHALLISGSIAFAIFILDTLFSLKKRPRVLR